MPNLDIKITTSADQSGVDQAVQGLGKVDAALKDLKSSQQGLTQEYKNEGQLASQRVAAADKFTASTRAAQAAGKGLAGELRGMQLAGAGANQAMAGLSQGGMQGLITTARGLTNVVKGLATGTIGAVLLPVLAVAGTAFAFLAAKANASGEAIKKMYSDAETNRAAYQSGLAEMKQAADASLQAQIEKVHELTAAYSGLVAGMDEAAARVGRLREAEQEVAASQIDRDEAAALATATTDEERSAIRAGAASQRANLKSSYASAAQESDVLNAKNRETNANRTISAASARQYEADKEVEAARAEYQNALDITRTAGDDTSSAAVAGRNAARMAKAKLDRAEANASSVRAELAPTIATAEKEIASARETFQLAPLREQALTNRTQAGTFSRSAGLAAPVRPAAAPSSNRAPAALPDYEASLTGLRSALGSVTPGDFASENRLAAELSRISAERDAAYQAMANFADGERKARTDLERNIQATAERSGGG